MAARQTTPSDDAPAQRRGAARFARVLVEPARAAALLAHSPVNTELAPPPATRPTASAHHLHHQRSTPQPVRRTLFSRLFRLKARDAEERGVSVSAAASPASHQSTPTHHYEPGTDPQAAAASTDASSAAPAASQPHGDDRRHMPGFARAASMPYNNGKPAKMAAKRASNAGVCVTPTDEDDEPAPMTRILLEGALVKLSSHKYWHAKATFFVLEEATTESEARSRLWLKQFKKQRKPSEGGDAEPPIMEIELTEFDVVVDISDRYIKHGLELFHRSPALKVGDQQSSGPDDSVPVAQGDLHSLRLSVDDIGMHRKWMRVLGSAIARLIDQSKRHYPITPADVEFARGTLKAFEPQAVTAIVGTSIPVKGAAKVRPIISSSSSSDDDDDSVHENQGELMIDDGDCDRASEVRDPEEPETHSDHEEVEPERMSLSAISDGFSDSWESPHHHNNNADPDEDNNNERSSNQFEDHEDGDQQLHAHSRRLSECYSPSDYVDVAVATSNMAQASPTGTASVASTPSPQSVNPSTQGRTGTRASEDRDEAEVENVAAAMAAASLAAEDAVMTPPTTPPRSSNKPLYARHHPLATHSRLGSVVRPQVHSFNANGQVFTLDVRYQLQKSIGNGAYGAVIAASDSVADMSVAVKKITNIFDDLVDAKRILREVRLLRHFHHKNITQLLDLAPPMAKKSFEDMYIITELMETDLHQVIYSMQPMSDDHVKYFLYQMLCALYHIHSAGVLHRDMKPSNILLNSNCDLKVCDFGLARGGMDANTDARKLAQPGELTEYVVTRWYRAPEIMLNCLQYTAAIDVWAVGCIFAEMLLREPLFPGNDYMHQLKLIIKFLGTPKQDDIGFVKNVKALRFLTKLSISKPKKWREVFTGEDLNPLALDLLAQMLIFNPEKRISVEQALQHPYLATFYDPADITRASPFSFDFDLPDDKLTKEALVDLLCEDVECFHPALMRSMKQPPPPQMPMPMLPRPPMVATANGGNRYFGTTASAS